MMTELEKIFVKNLVQNMGCLLEMGQQQCI